jgi:hypothetical protein
MHGVIASACWAIPAEACLLETPYALSGAALNNAPTKGVTRRAPGTRIPMPTPLVAVRSEARVWAGAALAGEGDLDAARDELVARRLTAITGQPIDGAGPSARARGTSFWIVRETGDELRVIEESFSR